MLHVFLESSCYSYGLEFTLQLLQQHHTLGRVLGFWSSTVLVLVYIWWIVLPTHAQCRSGKPSMWVSTLTNQAAHKLPTLWPSAYIHEYLSLGNFSTYGIRVVQVLYLIIEYTHHQHHFRMSCKSTIWDPGRHVHTCTPKSTIGRDTVFLHRVFSWHKYILYQAMPSLVLSVSSCHAVHVQSCIPQVHARYTGTGARSGGSGRDCDDPGWQRHEPAEHGRLPLCGTFLWEGSEVGEVPVTHQWSCGRKWVHWSGVNSCHRIPSSCTQINSHGIIYTHGSVHACTLASFPGRAAREQG